MANTSPWMTDDLEALGDATRKFFAREFAPKEERWWKQGHIDREDWLKAGEMGLLCASIPTEYGGGGGTFAHEAVITFEMVKGMISSFGNNVHSGIMAHYILAYGTEEQRQRWLPRMATGEMVGAIAMTEPGAGSDLQGVRTTAIRKGDEYVLNGSKTFITNGWLADLICVVAKTDPAQKGRGISLVMVETKDLPGFKRGRILEKIGQKGQDTAELFFDDVRVPVENLLGGVEGRGFAHLMQQLPQERMLIAIGAVAAMERAVEETVAYTRQRKAFGQSLYEMQNTRFKLAECATMAKIGRTFVDDCIVKALDKTLDLPTAAMAKWWTTDAANKVIDECVQLHGGYGYMMEYPIARMYANARVNRIYGGANEIMKELIARSL
jgi:acyl-CoA dehydrogenase